MESKDIIKALESYISDIKCAKCGFKDKYLLAIIKSALDLIKNQQAENEKLEELVDEMSYYFPACIDCDGKDNFGARTDKCVYLIDKTNFCAKQGIKNIASIQKENQSLKCELKTAKTEAYKEFVDKLCEGRVPNDNTVILAKCLLKELTERKEIEENESKHW